jgi:hypothetical protein
VAKPSLAEALGGYSEGEGEMSHGGDDSEVYVADLASALGVKKEKAQAVYDVICAIVLSKSVDGGGEVTVTVSR